MKKLLLLIMLMCSVAVSACGSEPQKEAMPPATAVFETNMGNFEVALATDLAPNTCITTMILRITIPCYATISSTIISKRLLRRQIFM